MGRAKKPKTNMTTREIAEGMAVILRHRRPAPEAEPEPEPKKPVGRPRTGNAARARVQIILAPDLLEVLHQDWLAAQALGLRTSLPELATVRARRGAGLA